MPQFREKKYKSTVYLPKQPLQSSLETLRSLLFSLLSTEELSFYSTQARNKLQERTAHAQLWLGERASGAACFQSGIFFSGGRGQRPKKIRALRKLAGSCKLF